MPRIARGESMPGVLIIPQWLAVGAALDDLLLVAESELGRIRGHRVRERCASRGRF
jgi:hypothetical protein